MKGRYGIGYGGYYAGGTCRVLVEGLFGDPSLCPSKRPRVASVEQGARERPADLWGWSGLEPAAFAGLSPKQGNPARTWEVNPDGLEPR